MSRPKRSRPVEDYKPRWDKHDDIFEVVSDMFGASGQWAGEPVPPESPLTSERTGPVTSHVTGVRGWSRPSDHLPRILDEALGVHPSPVTSELPGLITLEPVTSVRAGPITSEPVTSKKIGPAPAAHRARTVQDGHSMAEQHVYDTLWREARPTLEEYREITIGYRALAEKARLHRNTIDRNLGSLQAKMAIEIIKAEDRAENIGRTYRVYGFRNILNRREAAGLIWFIKDRSGVRLVRDQAPGPATSEVIRPITSERRGPVTFARTGAVISQVVAPVTSEVTSNKEEGNLLDTSSTSVVALALREELGYVDDDAVRRIVLDCRKRAADATPEEIADLARVTARRLRNMQNLTNPIGLLIIQVPKCFEGESFKFYRQSEFARKDAEKQNLIRIATEILHDPDGPEDSRKWAAKILATRPTTDAPAQSDERNSEKS